MQALSLRSQTRIELTNKFRLTIVHIAGGLIVLAGLYVAYRRMITFENQLKAVESGQITERFSRAIEHLGSTDKDGTPNIEVRLGGIYALERIAKDSQRDHWPIMEILTAYVRQNSPWNEKMADDEEHERKFQPDEDQDLGIISIELQAILSVIGRRNLDYEKGEGRTLGLGGSKLRGGVLSGEGFKGANFLGSDLSYTDLRNGNFQSASFMGADFSVANVDRADFRGIDLLHLDFSQILSAQNPLDAIYDPKYEKFLRKRYAELNPNG